MSVCGGGGWGWVCGVGVGVSVDFPILYDRDDKQIHITQVKFPKKVSFGPNGQFYPDCGSILCKLISQDTPEGFFQTLQHDRGQ